jgi:chemotaxis response regulator CheB
LNRITLLAMEKKFQLNQLSRIVEYSRLSQGELRHASCQILAAQETHGGIKRMKKKSSSARRKQKPLKTAPGDTPVSPASDSFPIVGIGASAGGLEALEHFLSRMPKDSGMAFVIVQHLDPTRKGIMSELLQRTTGMKVIQVKDRTRVQPNCVYVIPPNKDMSILHGTLHLLDPASPRGLRLPIDFFLRSLAQDQHEHSIAVILSGMGSDGTLGLQAIKEKAGVVITFVDITAAKTLEAQLREKHAVLEKHVAKQSVQTEQARDKVTGETVERKGIKYGAEKAAAPAQP